MSIVKRLSAQIDATDNGFKKILNSVYKDLDSLERKSEKATRSNASMFKRMERSANDFGKSLQNTEKRINNLAKPIGNVGSTLTNVITKPALTAGVAVGGLFATLGTKRLIAKDTALAKMKGVLSEGKTTAEMTSEELDRFNQRVKDTNRDVTQATLTGMTTFAEGMEVAAGAMGAGVKQGKDLQNYIKLVGNASEASGTPIMEMANILNRVRGEGKLSGNELEMINQRLPGFTAHLAEYFKVTEVEMREMVRNGEVSAEDLENALRTRVGASASFIAESWQGTARNLMAYIGIIGEGVMSGLFDASKDALTSVQDALLITDADIQKPLQTLKEQLDSGAISQDEYNKKVDELEASVGSVKPEIMDMATTVGEHLANGFQRAFTFIKRVVTWFNELSSTTKKAIGIFALVMVALGPFLAMLSKFLTMGGRLIGIVGTLLRSIGMIGSVLGFLVSPIGLAVLAIAGLVTAFVLAYQKSERFREVVSTVFENVKNIIIMAGTVIGEFISGLFAQIRTYWEENGEQVLTAFKNIWSGILSAIEFVTPLIQILFHGLMIFIGLIWDSIKGTIQGALNMILGIVSIFTGIFTGDFQMMWEGVKQLFFGAIQFVWNLFSLMFYGRILRGVTSLVTMFTGSIRGLWTTVVNFFKNMFIGAVKQVSSLYNRTVNIGNLIRSAFSKVIDIMKNKVISIFKNMFTRSVEAVSNLYKRVTGLGNNIREGLSKAISGAKTRVINLFKTMKDDSIKQLNKLLDGVKTLPGKMKDALVNGKNKVKDGIKQLGNSMTSKLGDVVNGVIGGINTVMEKIGIEKRLSKWDVPTFSTGTNGQGSPTGRLTSNGKIAMDTLAVVGDRGRGNGEGTRELVHYPNGQVGLYDNDAMIFAPKGTTIFNNQQTEDILNQVPQFSLGTLWNKGKEVAGKAWQGAKNVGSKVKNVAGKAIDYISNPSKIFEDLVSAVMPKWDMSNFMLNFAKGVWKQTKEALFGWMKDRFSEAGKGKKQAWMKRFPITTPYSPNKAVPGYPKSFNGGRHYGIDWGTPPGTNLTSPIAGTVKYQSDHGGGRVARVDYGKGAMYFLHMSSVNRGKVAIGDSLGRSGNSGAYTTGPHVHVQDENPETAFLQNRNTHDPLKRLEGYAKGGIITSPQIAWLAEGGFAESVISHDPKHRVRSRNIYERTGELLGFDEDKVDLSDVIKLLDINNQLTEASLSVERDILDKDTDIYLDRERVGKATAKDVKRTLDKEERLLARYREV